MNPDTSYTSVKNTKILNIDNNLVQVGLGFVVFTRPASSDLQVWFSGEEYLYRDHLTGCYLQKFTYVTVYGTDHVGKCRHAVLDYTMNVRPERPGVEGDAKIILTCEQVDRLLRGCNFASIAAECDGAVQEEKLRRLTEKAHFGTMALDALVQIYAINSGGGSQSRTKVTTIIRTLVSDVDERAAKISTFSSSSSRIDG